MSSVPKININLRCSERRHAKKRKILSNNYKTVPNDFHLLSFIKERKMQETKNVFFIRLKNGEKNNPQKQTIQSIRNTSVKVNKPQRIPNLAPDKSEIFKEYAKRYGKESDGFKNFNFYKKDTLDPMNMLKIDQRYEKSIQIKNQHRFNIELLGYQKKMNKKQKQVKAIFNHRSISHDSKHQRNFPSRNRTYHIQRNQQQLYSPWSILIDEDEC